jgi:hypothetical protein
VFDVVSLFGEQILIFSFDEFNFMLRDLYKCVTKTEEGVI